MTQEKKSTFSVVSSMLKMAIATLCSRVLGLVREQVMAMYFGASGLTDAFLVAYRVPNMLRDLFAEGAFSAAFVPTFVKARQDSEEEAKKLFWNLFFTLGSVTFFLGLGIAIFSDEILTMIAPQFLQNPEKFQIASNLTKIMSPFLMLISLAALFMGSLNSMRVFFLPSVAPAFFNAVMIISMVSLPTVLIARDIHPIYSLGIGVLLGGVVQAFVQLPLLLKAGYRVQFPRPLVTPRVKEVVNKLGPGLIGFAATQVNLIVNTILATSTVVGAVSLLSYAFRLFQFPVGILSVSLGNSNLVHFSESFKSGDKESAISFLFSSFMLSNLIIVPTMVVIFLFDVEIVQLIFQRGKFTAEDSINTAKLLSIYAVGLPFYGILKIFVPTLYAIDKQKVPVMGSIFSIAFNIVFCLTLISKYSYPILAAGTTISVFINVMILSVALKKYLELPMKFFMNLRIIKIVIAGGITFLATSYLKTNIINFGDELLYNLSVFFFSAIAIFLIYGALIYIMGEREAVLSMVQRIKSKISK